VNLEIVPVVEVAYLVEVVDDVQPVSTKEQVRSNGGWIDLPKGSGVGVEPDRNFIMRYSID
jgi:L-alanine-DL-glutamate epimerase-like enolase superfamily enzyme